MKNKMKQREEEAAFWKSAAPAGYKMVAFTPGTAATYQGPDKEHLRLDQGAATTIVDLRSNMEWMLKVFTYPDKGESEAMKRIHRIGRHILNQMDNPNRDMTMIIYNINSILSESDPKNLPEESLAEFIGKNARVL